MSSNYQKIANNIVEQYATKKQRDRLTHDDWNQVLKILATQLNLMGSNMDFLNEQVASISELDEEAVARIITRLDEHQRLLENVGEGSRIHIGDSTPDFSKVMLWFDPVNDEEVLTEPVVQMQTFMQPEETVENLFITPKETLLPSENTGDDILIKQNESEENLIYADSSEKLLL